MCTILTFQSSFFKHSHQYEVEEELVAEGDVEATYTEYVKPAESTDSGITYLKEDSETKEDAIIPDNDVVLPAPKKDDGRIEE